MSVVAQERDVEEPIELRALAQRAVSKLWWVISCVVLFTAGLAAAALLMPPVYRATTVLAAATSDRGADLVGFAASPLGGLASGLGLGPRDADTDEALAVLRSREFTERFIVSENLMPKLFSGQWNAATASWKADAAHRGLLYAMFRSSGGSD
jgi:uncharacterized protein involved in exopolysaccharide biosynthesis